MFRLVKWYLDFVTPEGGAVLSGSPSCPPLPESSAPLSPRVSTRPGSSGQRPPSGPEQPQSRHSPGSRWEWTSHDRTGDFPASRRPARDGSTGLDCRLLVIEEGLA